MGAERGRRASLSDTPSGQERLKHCQLALEGAGAEGCSSSRAAGRSPAGGKGAQRARVDPETVLRFKVEKAGGRILGQSGERRSRGTMAPPSSRERIQARQYDIVAQPANGSSTCCANTVMLEGRRLGALLSVPTESDCRFWKPRRRCRR